jgi:hypothetical protein
VLLAENGQPVWAWMALAAGSLTRPQVAVLAVLLGIVFLGKFSVRQTVVALSWTVIAAFLLLTPFTLATSPSLPVDIAANTLRVQEGGGNEDTLTTVSLDAYSIWPLVSGAVDGRSGLARIFEPSAAPLLGKVSYQRVSQLLTGAALLAVALLLFLHARTSSRRGEYLPLVTLGLVAFLMLKTGLVATHFLLALPFLLLCRRWIGTTAYFLAVGVWTATTLVPMYGDLGLVIAAVAGQASALRPAINPVTRLFIQLYASDWFMTAGILANSGVLLLLAWTSLRPARVVAAGRRFTGQPRWASAAEEAS